MFVVATVLAVAVVVGASVWPTVVSGGHRPLIARCPVVIMTVLARRRMRTVAVGLVI